MTRSDYLYWADGGVFVGHGVYDHFRQSSYL